MTFKYENIHQALLVSLTCVAAFWLSSYFNFKEPYWMLLTIIILLSDATNFPIRKGLLRLGGTIAGMMLGLICVQFCIDSKLAMSLSLLTVITVINYFGFKSLYQYAYFYAGLTFLLVYMIAAIDADSFEYFIAWRVSEIAVGVVICMLVSCLNIYAIKEKLPVKNDCLKRSFKIALNAYLSFLACIAIGWYGLIPGMVSAYVITAEATYEGAVRKATHRFFGCIIGGLLALSYLRYIEQTAVSISMFVFIGIFSLVYMRLTYTSMSYVFLQAALALSITVVGSGNETVNEIVPALQRLSGILLGGGISLITSALLFPAAHQVVLPKNSQ